MSAWRKVGGFLIGLGIFLLILFIISDTVKQPDFGILAGGFGCVVAGGFFLATHPAPEPPPAPRFRVLKRRKDEPKPKREPSEMTEGSTKEENEKSRKRK